MNLYLLSHLWKFKVVSIVAVVIFGYTPDCVPDMMVGSLNILLQSLNKPSYDVASF